MYKPLTITKNMPSVDTQFKKGHTLNVDKRWTCRIGYHGNGTSFKKGRSAHNKGIPISEETRLKIIKKSLGKVPWNKGRKETRLEVLNKQSSSHIGITPTIEHRKKISETHKKNKERSHLWKGGVTKINRAIRTSFEYKLWREAVFKRDIYTCVWCGKKGGAIEADHIKRFSDFPELRFAIDNGRTLCIPCHKTTDTYGNKKNKCHINK